MDRLEMLQTALAAVQLAFVFAVGACIGSLVNVLVYRLPKGMSVVTPASRCPSCQTKLTWRENIPILGWVILRGQCRFCKARISPEYPLVELLVAGLFAGLFAIFYLTPVGSTLAGLPVGEVAPEWARAGLKQTWPIFTVLLTLVACLVAMTLVDAKTFTIPLVLTWTPAAVALAFHPAWAAYIQWTEASLWSRAPGWTWSLASPGPAGWWWVGASLGGAVGLIIANVLLEKGLIRRSFADYEEWEQRVRREAAAGEANADGGSSGPEKPRPASADGESSGPERPRPDIQPAAAAAEIAAPVQVPPAPPEAPPVEARDVPVVGTPVPGAPPDGDPTQLWIRYPHARREMFKEIVFLAPCLALAVGGGALARWLAGPWPFDFQANQFVPSVAVPLWLDVLAGVLMGYLIGGGVVWGVRIAGSVAFGKEAMGLGDVHLMGAVGACLGWIDSVLAFFGAAFVALAWALGSRLSSGRLRRAMPYGPFLALATLLVLLGKPWIERAFSAVVHGPVSLP